MPLTLGDSCLVMDLAITYDDEAEVKKLYVNGELAVESNDAVAEKNPHHGAESSKTGGNRVWALSPAPASSPRKLGIC